MKLRRDWLRILRIIPLLPHSPGKGRVKGGEVFGTGDILMDKHPAPPGSPAGESGPGEFVRKSPWNYAS